jgi:hypothetical protein
VRLSQVAGEGSWLRYSYDFSDGWQHDVIMEKVLSRQPGLRYPCCVAGRPACPPEDVGGPWGYQHFLAAVSDAGHDEHGQWVEWAGAGSTRLSSTWRRWARHCGRSRGPRARWGLCADRDWSRAKDGLRQPSPADGAAAPTAAHDPCLKSPAKVSSAIAG